MDRSEFEILDELFDELWPIMRSITGPGIEQSIELLQKYMPLELEKVPSGTTVFDWETPPEWHYRSAKLFAPDGSVVCDADHNNLHLVNYSEPFSGTVSLEELQKHLHSIPEYLDVIPYVTSYYKRTWGFCLSQNVRDGLKAGEYRVEIDTAFVQGGVPFAQCVLQGESDREILLTSYLCHPSMANNELSGPLVLLAIYRRIKQWKRRRFTYRFLINPETIGSLCFLSKYGDHLKSKLASGFVFTCLGGDAMNLHYKSSRKKGSLVNEVIGHLESRRPEWIKKMPFTAAEGSDERQFCSPGFDLPMGQLSRTTYDTYAGYHNSLDTKPFMGVDRLVDSAERIEVILRTLEIAGKPVSLYPYGEPQLGRRNLYPSTNSNITRVRASSDGLEDGRQRLNRMLTVLNMADGHNSLIEIAETANCTLEDLRPIVEILEENELIRYNIPPIAN